MNAIEFDQVGKLYRLGQVGTGTLSHDLNRWWQTRILGREDPYLRVGERDHSRVRGLDGQFLLDFRLRLLGIGNCKVKCHDGPSFQGSLSYSQTGSAAKRVTPFRHIPAACWP